MKSAWATSFATPNASQAIHAAAGIFRGTTGKSEGSKWTNPEGKSGFYTFTEFKIEKILKYAPAAGGDSSAPRVGDTIYLREFGGQSEQYSVQVSGTVSFEPGEDIVIFVKEEEGSFNELPVFPVKGMTLAKLTVKNEKLDGALLTFRDQNKDLGLEAGQPLTFGSFAKKVEAIEKNPETVTTDEVPVIQDSDGHDLSHADAPPAEAKTTPTTPAVPATTVENSSIPSAGQAYGKYYVSVVVLAAFVYIYLKSRKKNKKKKK